MLTKSQLKNAKAAALKHCLRNQEESGKLAFRGPVKDGSFNVWIDEHLIITLPDGWNEYRGVQEPEIGEWKPAGKETVSPSAVLMVEEKLRRELGMEPFDIQFFDLEELKRIKSSGYKRIYFPEIGRGIDIDYAIDAVAITSDGKTDGVKVAYRNNKFMTVGDGAYVIVMACFITAISSNTYVAEERRI